MQSHGVIDGQQAGGVAMGMPVAGGAVQPPPQGVSGGQVVCAVTVHDGTGPLCGNPAQYSCGNCGRAICLRHRRFWMNEVLCEMCQKQEMKNGGGGVVFCCAVQ